jgi:hypothetical protein
VCYVCLSTAPCATRLTYNLLRPPQDLIEGDLQMSSITRRLSTTGGSAGGCAGHAQRTAGYCACSDGGGLQGTQEASEAAENYRHRRQSPRCLPGATVCVFVGAASCPVLSACLLTWRKHTCHLHSSVLLHLSAPCCASCAHERGAARRSNHRHDLPQRLPGRKAKCRTQRRQPN